MLVIFKEVYIFNKIFKSKKEIWLKDCLEANEKKLVRYVYSLVKDLEIAQDIVQDSFLKLWQQDLELLKNREAEWLFTVCRNQSYDFLRKKERKHISSTDLDLDLPDQSLTAEESLAENDQNKEVSELLSQLSKAQQEVLHLKFQQGLSYKEISQITGMSVNHVGVFIHNTVTFLKEKAQLRGAL